MRKYNVNRTTEKKYIQNVQKCGICCYCLSLFFPHKKRKKKSTASEYNMEEKNFQLIMNNKKVKKKMERIIPLADSGTTIVTRPIQSQKIFTMHSIILITFLHKEYTNAIKHFFSSRFIFFCFVVSFFLHFLLSLVLSLFHF